MRRSFMLALLIALLAMSTPVRSQSFAPNGTTSHTRNACDANQVLWRDALATGMLVKLSRDGIFEIGRIAILVNPKSAAFRQLDAYASAEIRQAVELTLLPAATPTQDTREGFTHSGTLIMADGGAMVEGDKGYISLVTTDNCQLEFLQKYQDRAVHLSVRIQREPRVLDRISKLQ